jgi:hypothetical protein
MIGPSTPRSAWPRDQAHMVLNYALAFLRKSIAGAAAD